MKVAFMIHVPSPLTDAKEAVYAANYAAFRYGAK